MSSAQPTLDQVCEHAVRLPCSPALLPRLIAVLSDPSTAADEVAGIVKLDPGLAAATLRLANSAYFGAEAAADSIHDAVIRLGQSELYRLAALALVSRWETGTVYGEPGDFCRHALCTALAAEVLATTTERVVPDQAYTAGLVADLGKLALLHATPSAWPRIGAHCAAHGCSWSEGERALLGYTHAQVGARLLRAWRFPAPLIDATEFWERPEAAPEDSRALTAHLHAGKFIATSCGPGVVDDGFLFALDPALLLARGFTPELLQAVMLVVHERANQRLGARLSSGPITF